ncbi:hypothetical protein ACF09L_32625 [Streptomyces sp. NPDC014779]|uniref:hypothetical protein n=1 Tax=Streptomyces sp. NPDC014779 TaxID=3364911 RepID=UPI003702AEFC
MARVYATVAQYEAYTGTSPAPADTGTKLARASRMLDRAVLRYCAYDTDGFGFPTNEVVAEAIANATCAQVEWWADTGSNPSGADGVGWGSVAIGSVQLGRSLTAVSGEDSPARQLAPDGLDALQGPDLTPDIFRMGAITSC